MVSVLARRRLSAVARQHGPGVRQEVLGETLQTRFGEAVQAHQLKIAGYPRFEPKAGQTAAAEMTFSASFEVYPEVKIDDLSAGKISRPVVNLGDADVAKTLEVLQKQRRTFEVHRSGCSRRRSGQVRLPGHGRWRGV